MNMTPSITTPTTRKREYTIENFTIDPVTIDQFEIIPNRRQVSELQVAKIHGVLIAGKNPIGVLIVNKRGGQYRLIDGNHRIEAIKRFYSYREIFKDTKIECILKVYENLTDEEEREVYSDEATRRNESYEDRLNIYKDTIMFWKLLNDPVNTFPCKVSIYQAKDVLRFRAILYALSTIKNSTGSGYHPTYLRKEELIPFAKSLTYDDFVLLKEFVSFFQETFGKIGKENAYTSAQYFIPIFDIYTKNRQHCNDATFKERFQRFIGRADIMNYSNSIGRESQSKIRALMIGYANHRVSKNLFV